MRGEGRLEGGLSSKDLSRHPIACHARLRGPPVGAHLKPDDALALLELVVREGPPVLLGFPGEARGRVAG